MNVFFTRDWHPEDHASFSSNPEYKHGSWPFHCVRGTEGAEFPRQLNVPENAEVINKATTPDKEAYSGFDGTDLDERLKSLGINRIFVAGLAADYCVKSTVLDGLRLGFEVFLIKDATRGINKVDEAIDEMASSGAKIIESSQFSIRK